MKFALKLSDDRFLELNVREISESEAADLPEERVFAAESEAPSGGRRIRRVLPLALVAIGIVALARRRRSADESGDIDVDVEPESIEVEG